MGTSPSSYIQVPPPRAEDEESSLLNIVTGQVPPKEIENQLLNAQTTGLNYMDEFVDERFIKKDKGFFDTLSKLQLKTFADLKKPFKGTTKDNKTYSIKADRDLFSRLVVIARRREIDLENIFTYELASVPLSLARLDGPLNKTAKSKLLQELECHGSNYPSLPPEEKLTSWIIDGMVLLQILGHGKAATFVELASNIFDVVRQLFNTLSVLRVDIVFDRYDTEHSIKEIERQRQQNVSGYEVQIYSSSVPVPKLWDKFISNNTNKAKLAKFLCEHWSSQYVACVPSGKCFF